MLRRLKAAGVITIAWAIAWCLGGVVLGALSFLRLNVLLRGGLPVLEAGRIVMFFALVWAAIGGINGLAFSTLLGILGPRRQGRLSMLTVAGLGAIAGSIIPLVIGLALLPIEIRYGNLSGVLGYLGVTTFGAVLGAISAGATFGIARVGAAREAEPVVAG